MLLFHRLLPQACFSSQFSHCPSIATPNPTFLIIILFLGSLKAMFLTLVKSFPQILDAFIYRISLLRSIFCHYFKLQISKIKLLNSPRLFLTTPTWLSSSRLSYLSKCRHHPVVQAKNPEVILIASPSATSNQSPSSVNSTSFISLKVVHVYIPTTNRLIPNHPLLSTVAL